MKKKRLMKLNNKIRAIVMCLFLAVTFPLIAQQVEKKVAGKTYVYDYDKKKVYNKKFSVVSQDFSREGYTVKQNTIVADVFRSVLGKKRIEKLGQKGERVIMSFVWNANGMLESVRFIFPHEIFLTPEEIAAIENKLLSVKLPIIVERGIKKIGGSQVLRFSVLKDL